MTYLSSAVSVTGCGIHLLLYTTIPFPHPLDAASDEASDAASDAASDNSKCSSRSKRRPRKKYAKPIRRLEEGYSYYTPRVGDETTPSPFIQSLPAAPNGGSRDEERVIIKSSPDAQNGTNARGRYKT